MIKNFNHKFDLKTAAFLANMARLAYWPAEAAANAFEELGALATVPIEKDNHEAFVVHFEAFVIIVFRGTEKDYEDILTDLDCDLEKPTENSAAEIHDGFLKGTRALYLQLITAIRTTKAKEKPVFFCGHSLGGAFAQLSAWMLADEFDQKPIVYTFGSPRVGSKHLDPLFKHWFTHFRIVNGCDIVPSVPLVVMGYRHSQNVEIYLSSSGSVELNPSAVWRKLNELWDTVEGLADGLRAKIPVRRFTRHKIAEYVDRLEAADG